MRTGHLFALHVLYPQSKAQQIIGDQFLGITIGITRHNGILTHRCYCKKNRKPKTVKDKKQVGKHLPRYIITVLSRAVHCWVSASMCANERQTKWQKKKESEKESKQKKERLTEIQIYTCVGRQFIFKQDEDKSKCVKQDELFIALASLFVCLFLQSACLPFFLSACLLFLRTQHTRNQQKLTYTALFDPRPKCSSKSRTRYW
jgi:hypothetical protein